jgi:hypothetical protein
MCLLVVASPNSTPRKKDLECASCNNPHGFGFAVVTPNGIVTGRGMSSKKVIKQFLEVRKQYPESYAMYHARYATHGVKNEDNCHPFKVPSQFDTYLAHNGILDIDIKAGDRRSDTRIFAEDTLPAMVAYAGHLSLTDTHPTRKVRYGNMTTTSDLREVLIDYLQYLTSETDIRLDKKIAQVRLLLREVA